MKNSLIFSFFILFFQSNYSQTVVIIKIDNDSNRIVAAADSRVSNKRFGSPDKAPGTICKLHNYGQCSTAVIGYFYQENIRESEKVIHVGSNIAFITNTFAESFKLIVKQELVKVRKTLSSKAFKDLIESSSRAISQTIFFGYENRIAKISIVQFIVKSYSENDIEVVTNILDYLYSCKCAFAGDIDEIDKMTRDETTWNAGIVVTLKKLIQIQEKNHPEAVGGPIDILEVKYPDKMRWICKKKDCQ